jgi:hypothetical protein
VGCLLSVVTVSFAVQKLFGLMQSHLFIVLDDEPFKFYLGVIPYTYLFQCISFCFLEFVQSVMPYIKVFDPLIVEFDTG